MTAELSQIIDKVTLSKFAVVTLQPDQQMLSWYGRLDHNAGLPQPLPQQLRVPPRQCAPSAAATRSGFVPPPKYSEVACDPPQT